MTNHLVYGPNDIFLDVSGHAFAQVERAVAEILNLDPAKTAAYVDGRLVHDRSNFKIEDGQRVEWMKENGDKGIETWTEEDFREAYTVSSKEMLWCISEGMEVLTFKSGMRVTEKSEAIRFGQKLMKRRAKADDPQLIPSKFYDEDTFTVTWHGKSCRLGNTIPFRLFKKLAEWPGEPIRVEPLMQAGWPDDAPTYNLLHRQFSNLRNRLAEAGITGLKIDGTSNRGSYVLIVED